MKIYKGITGLDKSYRSPFTTTKKCRVCHGTCRMMFVAQEDGEDENKFISQIHPKNKEKFWPSDAISIAVYACENCFSINTDFNESDA